MRQFVYVAAFLVFNVTVAIANEGPRAACQLSEDGNTLSIIARNLSDQAYACQAECRYKLSDERPIYSKVCTYSLSANTQDKTVCSEQTNGSQTFAETLPVKMICQPR